MKQKAFFWREVLLVDVHLMLGLIAMSIQMRVSMRILLRCAEHLHKAFGDRVLIDDLSFNLPRNGIVGVIGPNGVGKSTLFKMIVGKEGFCWSDPLKPNALT